MYCIIWRHYKKDGIIPFTVSKYPDKFELKLDPTLDSNKQHSSLRSTKDGEPDFKDHREMRDLFNSYTESKKILENIVIHLDYNTLEDQIVFDSQESAKSYLEELMKLDWSRANPTIIFEKEINSLKELPAFQ